MNNYNNTNGSQISLQKQVEIFKQINFIKNTNNIHSFIH